MKFNVEYDTECQDQDGVPIIYHGLSDMVLRHDDEYGEWIDFEYDERTELHDGHGNTVMVHPHQIWRIYE